MIPFFSMFPFDLHCKHSQTKYCLMFPVGDQKRLKRNRNIAKKTLFPFLYRVSFASSRNNMKKVTVDQTCSKSIRKTQSKCSPCKQILVQSNNKDTKAMFITELDLLFPLRELKWANFT